MSDGTTVVNVSKNKQSEKGFRPIEELNLIDNFLFHTVLTQGEDGERLCRILLSTVLGRPIRKVRIVAQQSVLGLDTDLHGIRLDAYVEDISDETIMPGCEASDAEIIPDIYDIEPNNNYEKATLPQRMRYYHGLIDTKHLNTGVYYDKLPKVVIVVILPYDPFDRDRMVYTVKNRCVEEPDIPYEDGATKIFLYTKGTKGNASQALADMLKYIEHTNEENITNEDIRTIHEFVEKAKHRKEVGIQYMRLWEEYERMKREVQKAALEEGFAEGRAEGHAEGREVGLAEGIRVLVETCQELGVIRADCVKRIMDKFSLTPEDAAEKVEMYWKDDEE